MADNDTSATTSGDVTVVSGAVVDDQGVLAEAAIATDGAHALVVARFADRDAAGLVYEDLLMAEGDGSLHIDGVLVVNADDGGRLHIEKMTDHSTRTGLKWGIVGGVVAGIFLPATIIASAAVLGVAGMTAGKARNLSHRLDVEEELTGVITPGTSGILALVTAVDAPKVAAKMGKAEEVETVPVDEQTAQEIKQVAASVDAPDKPAPAAS
jgi:uncharacterized membrane protein